MLWNIIKGKMLNFPDKLLYDNQVCLTYEQVVVYVENFSQKLTKECYAILCHSELFEGIAILACLAAKATCIPLSYKYGKNHLNSIVDFINPPNVITDMGGTLQIVDTDTGMYIPPRVKPAFIMCTSGSTGKPKGVMLSEKNIYSNLKDICKYFDIDSKDRILIARPLHHCAVLTGEFFVALCKGVEIHFERDCYNPSKLIDVINTKKISVLCGTPTFFLMMGRLLKERIGESTLKNIVISGECLTQELFKQLKKYYFRQKVFHVYGLTEASPRVAYLSPDLFGEYGNKINKVLDSIEVKIINEKGEEAKKGERGELLVYGPNVMMGYYRNDKQTKKTLQNGWLHTGDCVFQDDAGMLEICGRMDDMIIRAGMNIYPSEIENKLKTSELVQNVVAYKFSKPNQTECIGIQIVGEFESVSQVRSICNKLLPSYAIPDSIEIVKEISNNASGKTIRPKTNLEGT